MTHLGKRIAPFAFLTLLSTTPAMADITQKGVYFGANGGYAAGDFEPDDSSTGNLDLKSGYTVNTFVGYNVLPFFGLEFGVGYVDLETEFDTKVSGEVGRLGISLWGDLTKTLGIYNKFQYAYAQAGFDQGGDEKEGGSGFYYEIGLSYELTHFMHLTTSASYLSTSMDSFKVNQYSGLVGLQFNF